MSSNQSPSVKRKLLQMSEVIVDLSECMEVAESTKDERTIYTSKQRLRVIGDELVDQLTLTSGDDLAFARFMMGSVCSLLGYWNQAEKSFRDALAWWPDHVGILNELFEALIAQRKYSEAEEVIKTSMKYGGETPAILRNHAAVLVHLKKLNEARLVMIDCIARFPNDQESRSFLQKLESAGHS